MSASPNLSRATEDGVEVAIAEGIARVEASQGALSEYEIRAFRLGFFAGAEHGLALAQKEIKRATG